MSLWFKVLTGLIVIVASVTLGIMSLTQPMKVSDTQELEVKKGQSAISLIDQLERDNIIKYGLIIKLWFRLYDELAAIKSGTYAINPDDTLEAFWERVIEGDEIQYQVTLVEGLTWSQWKQTLLTHPKLINDLNEEQLLAQIEYSSLEGLLMPETYTFPSKTSVTWLVQKAMQDMQLFLSEQWGQRSSSLELANAYDALIMASIIEKETALVDEMGKISGVFHNRLVENMRLQTDPTVIYGIGESFDGNLTRTHLRTPTPYNTYTIKGLPPTPIAMPSKRAIIAALNPAPTNALFFVAKGDGSHYFSSTLDEHNQAVRRYQLGQE